VNTQTAFAPPPPPPANNITAAAPAPLPFHQRISAMDVARGFALLGIFCVNIQCFALPLIYLTTPSAGASGSAGDTAWWLFVSTLCESKFYSLFSLLFGMGFIILSDRAHTRRPESAVPIALRRFGFLALLGFLHANLLWYGDILFIYAFGGLALLLFRKLKPRTMLTVGAILILVGELLVWLTVAAGVIFTPPRNPAPVSTQNATAPAPLSESAPSTTIPDHVNPGVVDPAPDPAPDLEQDALAAARDRAAESRDRALNTNNTASEAQPTPTPAEPLRGMEALRNLRGGPESETWITAETLAFRDGPYTDLALFRSITWASMLFFVVPFMGPRILGLFLLGAALIRMDFFNPARAPLHRRLITLGLAVGIPCAAVAAVGKLLTWNDGAMHISWLFWQLPYAVGCILIPLAILAAAARLTDRARHNPRALLSKALHPPRLHRTHGPHQLPHPDRGRHHPLLLLRLWPLRLLQRPRTRRHRLRRLRLPARHQHPLVQDVLDRPRRVGLALLHLPPTHALPPKHVRISMSERSVWVLWDNSPIFPPLWVDFSHILNQFGCSPAYSFAHVAHS
jgi:hypothetical protein